MKTFFKTFSLLLFSLILLFLFIGFLFSENNPPSQPNIEYKRIYSSDIESDTFISPNTFISFPSSYYSEEKHLLQASLFFTTKHSNIDSIHSFDFNKFFN